MEQGGRAQPPALTPLAQEIDRIGTALEMQRLDEWGRRIVDEQKLAQAAGLSRGGLKTAMSGRDPEAATLRALAQFAHERGVPGYEKPNPVRLFVAAGWMTWADLEIGPGQIVTDVDDVTLQLIRAINTLFPTLDDRTKAARVLDILQRLAGDDPPGDGQAEGGGRAS